VTDDLSALETFLRARLTDPLPGREAQRRFAPVPAAKDWEPDQQPAGARRAAALILIYPDRDGLRLPLTVRRDDLPHHPGQVSLPGGARDPGESDEDAALRETHEEIGVDPSTVRVVGSLSTLWVVVSGFLVRPVVGIVARRPTFRPDSREVAELVEAPLEHVRDATRVHWQQETRDGYIVRYPYLDLGGHRVWGATAMMLGEFASLWDPGYSPPEMTPRRK
jgi:8-oxo-dGTP pyrophosphatase MutT (NUDIX family)